jgi:hypothetical protein
MFLRRGKVWRKNIQAEPRLASDIITCYETLLLARNKLSDRLNRLQQRFADAEIDYSTFYQADFILIRMYALALCCVSILGTMVSAVASTYSGLEREMYDSAVEALSLAQRLSRCRPLGASIIPLALSFSWIGTTDQQQRHEIERTVREYLSDYPNVDTGTTLSGNLRALERRLKLMD